VEHELDLEDRRLARIVKQCRDLPGYELFQYVDADGTRQAVGSEDVNGYLKDITGQDVTSKDFRTWAGTVLAAQFLRECPPCASESAAKRTLVRAVEQVAQRLGNTKAVCRRCYIHPAVFDAYVEGAWTAAAARGTAARGRERLNHAEGAVLDMLQRRLARATRKKPARAAA